MPKWPVVAYDASDVINGGSKFTAFCGHFTSVSTESDCQQEIRDTYTASNLRVYLNDNSSGDVDFRLRTNGADDTMIATATGTGEFEDITNTDDLAQGDLICIEGDDVGGMHGDLYRLDAYQITLEASTNVPPMWGAGGEQGGLVWTADNDFASFIGTKNGLSEVTDEYVMKRARVLSELRLVALAHTGGSDPDIHVRKDGSNTSLTVTITGTGEFLDLTNTASYVSGEQVAYGASDVTTASDIIIKSMIAVYQLGLVNKLGFVFGLARTRLARK